MCFNIIPCASHLWRCASITLDGFWQASYAMPNLVWRPTWGAQSRWGISKQQKILLWKIGSSCLEAAAAEGRLSSPSPPLPRAVDLACFPFALRAWCLSPRLRSVMPSEIKVAPVTGHFFKNGQELDFRISIYHASLFPLYVSKGRAVGKCGMVW